ncbi:hypothetical protein AB1N83_012940 [Pleurotus pulmonarius]
MPNRSIDNHQKHGDAGHGSGGVCIKATDTTTTGLASHLGLLFSGKQWLKTAWADYTHEANPKVLQLRASSTSSVRGKFLCAKFIFQADYTTALSSFYVSPPPRRCLLTHPKTDFSTTKPNLWTYLCFAGRSDPKESGWMRSQRVMQHSQDRAITYEDRKS